ncbi:hypothetical protein TWF481_001514 [Arthrobotrys musiformis]|uniref:Uncharacterized protein n=1 Tax=Arthrobotrys musiformis TaxID=47236 RepID=A0AAV9WQS6_9PEZI
MAIGFLSLPRNIRDKIYAQVVLFDEPILTQEAIEDICGRKSPTAHNFATPSTVNLSIFRVNRQIHEEASFIFYTQNVFSIKVVTEAYESYNQHKQCFRARWTTPWEDIAYEFTEEDGVGHFCPGDYGGNLGNEILQKDIKTYIYPSVRYRHLLRHVRIEIVDTCFMEYYTQQAPIKRQSSVQGKRKTLYTLLRRPTFRKTNPGRVPLRTIFMPLACRLRCLLAACSSNVNIDITVSTTMLDNFDELSTKVYKDLVELASPFTKGYKTGNVNLYIPYEEDYELDPKYEGLKTKVLKNCSRETKIDGPDGQKFENVDVELMLHWRLLKGRLVIR